MGNAGNLIKRLFRQDRNTAIRTVNKSLVNVDSEYVYDLTVEPGHCYEVSGVLTSNSDAFGYWVHYEAPVKSIMQTPHRKVRVRDVRYG